MSELILEVGKSYKADIVSIVNHERTIEHRFKVTDRVKGMADNIEFDSDLRNANIYLEDLEGEVYLSLMRYPVFLILKFEKSSDQIGRHLFDHPLTLTEIEYTTKNSMDKRLVLSPQKVRLSQV